MSIEKVQSWMTFFGWSNGGSPGASKRDADGKVIANYGGAEWVKDVEEACAKTERAAIVAEIERRERLGIPTGQQSGESK